MRFELTFKYTEKDVIPPRCRKPRDIMHDDGHATVELSEVTGADAPVAIVMDEKYYTKERYERRTRKAEYRWYNDQLWLPWRRWDHETDDGQQVPVALADTEFVASILKSELGYGWLTIEGTQERIAAFAATHVFIDGIGYEPALEPMWQVWIDYMQRNNTSTVAVFSQTEIQGMEKKSNFYRADQYDMAVAEALRIHELMGGNTEIDPPMSVVMPEVLRRDPQNEFIVDEAERRRGIATEALAKASEFIRKALDELTHAEEVSDVDASKAKIALGKATEKIQELS